MYNLSKAKSAFAENSLQLLKILNIRNKTALFLSCQYSVYCNQEGRGKWAVYYTSPKSFIIKFLICWLNNFGDFC